MTTDPQLLYATIAGVCATFAAILGGFLATVAMDIGNRGRSVDREFLELRDAPDNLETVRRSAANQREIIVTNVQVLVLAVCMFSLLIVLVLGIAVPLIALTRSAFGRDTQRQVASLSLWSLWVSFNAMHGLSIALMTAGRRRLRFPIFHSFGIKHWASQYFLMVLIGTLILIQAIWQIL